MDAYRGKYQYQVGGRVTQEGACRVQFDAERVTISPEVGTPLVFDLGDLDAVIPADWEIRLPLFTGNTVVLRQLGKVTEQVAQELLGGYRDRTVQCLLLEDLAEVQRFSGTFEWSGPGEPPRGGPAELRLYRSNLAVLADTTQSFQWRLAEVDDVTFDSRGYQIILRSGEECLKLGRLAKRTEECLDRVREAVNDLQARSAEALHALFPFLNPDQLHTLSAGWREGRSVRVAGLAETDERMASALAARAVDADLRPYYDALLARTASGGPYLGFKLIREAAADDADPAAETEGSEGQEAREPDRREAAGIPTERTASDGDQAGPPVLFWFMFPLARPGSKDPAGLVAWEATSRAGRATYVFRLADAPGSLTPALVESGIRTLNRVLGMLNFRRRPIYLSDEELTTNPTFHRYAIAARRIPEVQQIRARYLGRALHTSPETWATQIAAILDKTRT